MQPDTTAFTRPLTSSLVVALEWVSGHRYVLLTSALLIQVIAFSLQGIWSEDFWEHSAAVSEFMQRPRSPTHPLLDVTAPHTFLNPYAFVVALAANSLGLTSITALSVFGIFNFCVLCTGLYVFVSGICKANAQRLAFYSLLFILFLWGGRPWPYSGFFSYQIFLFNLPYPSTLIGGLSLLTLGITSRQQLNLSLGQWLALTFITSLALLIHPLTAQFLVIGLVAQAIFSVTHVGMHILKIMLVCLVAASLASLWPYYSFLELLKGAGSVYHIANRDMYFHLMTRIWPFIIVFPFVGWVLIQDKHRPLLAMFVATIFVYLFGYFTQKYSYGRIISYTLIISQISCAILVAKAEDWLKNYKPSILLFSQTILLITLLLLSSQWLYSSTNRLLTAANSVRLGRPVFNQVSYQNFSFLTSTIPAGSTVLASLEISWLLPSFGVKTIAVDRALAFVKDADERKTEVVKFFSIASTSSEREAIINRYKPDFILLSKSRDASWQQILAELTPSRGALITPQQGDLILIRLN